MLELKAEFKSHLLPETFPELSGGPNLLCEAAISQKREVFLQSALPAILVAAIGRWYMTTVLDTSESLGVFLFLCKAVLSVE